VSHRGFTLLELLVVLMIVAISAGVVSLALRDGSSTRLEREASRLAALLEMARAESRVTGTVVRWVPGTEAERANAGADRSEAFRFVGMSTLNPLPTRWLGDGVVAQVVGADSVLLGPDALLAPQRIVLRLADQKIEVATDGLSPFAIAAEPAPR
jgi:general secretion pathway protein H